MRKVIVTSAVGLLALGTLAAATLTPAEARGGGAAPAHNPSAVLAWNETAVATVVAANQFQAEGMIHLGYVQAAVYDALMAVDGGFQPYATTLSAPAGADGDAAVAAAAHRILVLHYPTQQSGLDAAYSAAIASLPAGVARDQGVAVGEAAAYGLLAARTGDGSYAAVPYTFGSGPGAWVLPTDNPSTVPQTTWVGAMTPFVLRSASQFLPGPPPGLGSARWARDYNETKTYGSKTSTARSPEQTDVARFWSANVSATYNGTMRGVIVGRHLDRAEAARALVMTNMVGADSLMACLNAKYHYSFWRPFTAIRAGDTDGNAATAADPAWLPLLTTPNHPEYPAAHGCLTSAQSQILAAVVGSQRIDVDIYSSVTGTTRHYRTAADLTHEIVDARVWAGLHYRTSGEKGAQLGARVARWDLHHALAPADDDQDEDD